MSKKIFTEASNIKNTRNLFKIVQKWPFLTFAVLVTNFWNRNDCKLDENLRNLSIVSQILISKVGLHSFKTKESTSTLLKNVTNFVVLFCAGPLAHYDWTILLVEWEVSDVKVTSEASCDERRPRSNQSVSTTNILLIKCRILDFNRVLKHWNALMSLILFLCSEQRCKMKIIIFVPYLLGWKVKQSVGSFLLKPPHPPIYKKWKIGKKWGSFLLIPPHWFNSSHPLPPTP